MTHPAAPDGEGVRRMLLRDYRPVARVVLPETPVHTLAVPVIDAHNHLGRWLSEGWMTPQVGVLRRAGELGLPVLIHTADPVAFFDPLDATNERLDELSQSPGWWYGDRSRYPAFDGLMAALDRLLEAAGETTVIGAHVGCHAEHLDAVSAMLTRRFGSDAFPIDAQALRTAYRFLETDDEHFAYCPGEPIPPQGRWAVSGAALPHEHLVQIYRGNAVRLGL